MTKLVRSMAGLPSILVLTALVLMTGVAQAQAPITLTATTAQASYLDNEPITLEIRVRNTSGVDVITRKGFFDQNFHLQFTFIGPDGEVIRFTALPGQAEPGPPICFQGRCDAVLVEIIPPGGETAIVINDANAYYNLANKLGHIEAFVSVPFETFSTFVEDLATGEFFAFLDDPARQVVDPLTSNTIAFDILPLQPVASVDIQVFADLLTTTGTGPKPSATKEPLAGFPVRLFKRSEVRADFQPINHKTYHFVFQDEEPVQSTSTDAQGIAEFRGIEQDDYLIIGRFEKSDIGARDAIYVAAWVNANDPDWSSPVEKHLRVVNIISDGQVVPGRTTRRFGSELLITEPEFVLWDSTQALYPFVFESIGNWSVDTSVSPPLGFVSNFSSLRAKINTGLKAVQFTLTDVGSRWEETDVTYNIQHKGKKETLKHKIGVKLSKGLAQAKGVGPYGHTGSPGTFKGGKKVGQQ